jgi:hypothetical protein
MSQNLPARLSKPVADYLARAQATPPARLAIVLDATMSRQGTWDQACQWQSEMPIEAARLGGIAIQLIYFLGDEFHFLDWTISAHELAARMRRIQCKAGETQYGRAFAHIRSEHRKKKIDAAIIVGDAVEEEPPVLYDAAAGLGVPLFMFQEGDNPVRFPGSDNLTVEQVFRGIQAPDRGRLREVRFQRGASASRATAGCRRFRRRRPDRTRALGLGQRAQASDPTEIRAERMADDPILA